jgi:hypothetical protein
VIFSRLHFFKLFATQNKNSRKKEKEEFYFGWWYRGWCLVFLFHSIHYRIRPLLSMKCASSLLLLVSVVVADDLPPILDPAPYTTWVGTSSDGLSRRANIAVPFTNSSGDEDVVNMWRADLIGDATQRGIAHGELFASEIVELIEQALPAFFIVRL